MGINTDNEVILGDCLAVLKTLDDNSVHAVLTDPPYELGFMGQKWDSTGIAYKVEVWRECLRVLKPGGYLLAFSAPRTYHRMAVAIEDAGFELRDMLGWLYGSGFPKSLNVGKAVDALQGNERTLLGKVKGAASAMHDNLIAIRKGLRPEYELTQGTSEWEGYGTALKPAYEPICMARKPLSEKTVAANVLRWGTGALDIDGCRVATNDDLTRECKGWASALHEGYQRPSYENAKKQVFGSSDGRFPANIILDGSEEVNAIFPNTAPSKKASRGAGVNGNTFKSPAYEPTERGHNDNGGSAARFFYCAKAHKNERSAGVAGGNKHPTVKPLRLMEYLMRLVAKEGQIVLDPFGGSGTTGVAAIRTGRRFVLIEKEEEYFDIINQRLEYEQKRLAR